MDTILSIPSLDDPNTIYKYKLTNVGTMSYSASTQPIVINIPEMEQPIVFNFNGRTNKLSVRWKLVETGEDLALGTYKDTSGNVVEIITIQDQINYLKNHFITADIMTNATLTVTNDDGSTFLSIVGIVSSLRWDWNGCQMAVNASLTMIENMLG